MPVMADTDDSSGALDVLKLALKDFLECFPPPQTGRIVDGYEPDFNTHEAFNLPTGSILNFHRQVSPNVPLAFRDTWGGSKSDHLVKVTLPIEFQGKFKPLPFDPASGETSIDHIYPTVADLVNAFPVYVQVNSSWRLNENLQDEVGGNTSPVSLACGDRLKLIRLVHKYSCKLLECRRLSETRLLLLPMDCAGHFTALPDHNEYLLSDLMSMLPRRRRLQVSESTRAAHKIPGLPANFRGDLLLEEPEAFVEASPMDDPGLIIGLPSNLNITISPEDNSYDRGQLLNSFATNNRTLFPVVARLTDWDEETTILENHYVKPGIELVIHGWTRQSKVLAQTVEHGRHFAIPLTYQGQFRILPQRFNGVSELEHAHPAYKVRVVSKDADDTANIVEGDILRVKRSDSVTGKKLAEVTFVKCDKLDPSGKVREIIRLPIACSARFEEVLEENKAMNFWIRDLVSFVTDQELVVELVSSSTDQKVNERDLPDKTPITLCDFIIEPAVYVSVETAEAPAFHIPLRTLVYLTFVQQLEKSCSPLLTKQSPRLSTLDRCVEVLPLEVFNALQPRSRGENELTISALSAMQQQLNSTRPQPNAWSVAGGENGGGYNNYGGFGGPVMPHVGMRPQSFSTYGAVSHSQSVRSDKSRSFTARLKDKFRRHKSTENLHKASQQEFAPLSLPKQSHHRSQEFPMMHHDEHDGHNDHNRRNGHNGQNGHNEQNGFNGHNGHNGHNGDAISLSSQGNLTYRSRSSSSYKERWLVEVPIEMSRSNSTLEEGAEMCADRVVPQSQPADAGRSRGTTEEKKKSKSKKVIHTNGFHNGESSPEPGLYQNNQVNGVRPLTPQSNGGHSPETVSFTSSQFMQPQMMQPQMFGQPTQPGAGYMLMPMAQPAQVGTGFMMVPTMATAATPIGVPPGYMLVPMMPGMQQPMQTQQPLSIAPQNHQLPAASASSSEDDAESIAYSEISSRSRPQQLKVSIPQDGNLYNFSIKKMAEFFRQMRLSDETVRECIKDKVDGRKFSKFTEADLERYGLLHPVVIHFRRSTYKRRPNFML